MSNACPACGRDDYTRTLPALVEEGTYTMRTTGSSFGAAVTPGGIAPVAMVNRSSTSGQNTLASWVTFPVSSEPWGMLAWGIGLLAAGGIFAAGLSAIVFSAPVPPQEQVAIWEMAVFLLVYCWAWWLPGTLLVIFGRRALRRYRAEQPRRDRAWNTWNALRYCHRDGLVYLPGTGHAFHPSATKQFIFDYGSTET